MDSRYLARIIDNIIGPKSMDISVKSVGKGEIIDDARIYCTRIVD